MTIRLKDYKLTKVFKNVGIFHNTKDTTVLYVPFRKWTKEQARCMKQFTAPDSTKKFRHVGNC